MKHQRWSLWLILLACVAFSACTPKYTRHDGTHLTRPREGVTTIKVNNTGENPFFAGKDGERELEVLPGRYIKIHFKSEEEVKLNFTWFDDLGQRGQRKDRFQASQNGLYDDEIDVDEAFLWGMITVPVFVANQSNRPIIYKDNCLIGEPIIIPAFGYYWTAALPGSLYQCWWWPADVTNPIQTEPQYYCDTVPYKADKLFMGKRYARGINIHRASSTDW